MQKKSSIVLGIDPGTNVMGYALLKTHGNECTVLKMDVLKMSSEKDIYKRLEKIHSTIVELIKLYQPKTFAIEAPFFGKNA